jgi:GTP-binding protein
MCIFLLIDCRHNQQGIDKEFIEWLAENSIPFVLTFTKGDKLTKTALTKKVDEYKIEMLKSWEEIPKIFITSAENKKGLSEILIYIEYLNTQFKEYI